MIKRYIFSKLAPQQRKLLVVHRTFILIPHHTQGASPYRIKQQTRLCTGRLKQI